MVVIGLVVAAIANLIVTVIPDERGNTGKSTKCEQSSLGGWGVGKERKEGEFAHAFNKFRPKYPL